MPSEDSLWNEALYEAAREIGNPESPNDLARRGVRRVRSVSREKLSSLLNKAVEKALRKRGLGDAEVSDLVDNMQAGLLDLLHGARQVEIARSAMADQRRALEGELDAHGDDRIAPIGDPRFTLPPTTDSEVERAIRERDMTIDRLERRIAKLLAAFEETERAFQRALASKHLDAGIASLYRVVQGLSPNAPQVERKRALMEEIFRENVNLRAKFNSTS
jgi:hypothetical protein